MGQDKEAERLAALERLDAVRAEADEVLQELVDDVKDVFGADLCVVHLMLTDSLYFRAWAGPLPQNFVETREISSEQSMCPNVIGAEAPLIVEDLMASERFKDHFVCAVGGLRFYAGVPLVTSGGEVIGTLCVLGAEPRRFEDGELTTLSAFARAVVGRLELIGALRREQDAREVEARRGRELQRVLDESLDIFTTIGFDGEIKAVNRACVPVLGYEPEELLGRRYMDLIHPEDHALAVEAAKRLYRGETVALFQNRYIRKDGSMAWIEWTAAALPGEETYHCVARDVTARKLAEEELRRSEDRLNLATSSAKLGTFDFDPPTGELVWDERCKLVFGLPPDADVDYETFLAGVHPDDRERTDRAVQGALDPAGGGGFEIEYRTLGGRDGVERWVASRGQTFFDATGRATRFIGTVLDVTDEKLAGEEMRRERDLYEGLLDAQSSVGEAFVVLEGERITYANEALARICGYSVPELLELPTFFDLIPPEDRDGVRERMRRRLAGERSGGLIEAGVLHRSGRRVELEAGIRMLREDGRDRFVLVARDITGRKRAEAERERLSEDMRLLLESTGEGIYGMDRRGRCTFVNAAAAKMLGYGIHELIGEDIHALTHHAHIDGSHYPDEDCPISVASRTGEEFWSEDESFWRKDGTSFPVEYSCHPVVEDGQITGAVVTFSDITVRKKAEESRRESEERFKQLFEQSADALLVYDAEGRMLDCNSEACRSLGYTREELKSLSVRDFVVYPFQETGDIGAGDALWRRILADELGEVTNLLRWEHRRKDGSVFPVEVKLDAGDYGGRRAIFCSARDITERERAEVALRESEERHRLVAETASDAIVTIDAESTILSVNRAAERTFGYPKGRMVGQLLTMLMPENLRDAHEAAIKTYLVTGERRLVWDSIELPGLHASGREISLEVSFGEWAEDGERRFTGFIRDVSGRKDAERAVRDAEERYRGIFENAVEGIFQTTPDGRILTANPAMARIFGYETPEELMANVSDTGRQLYADPDRRAEFTLLMEERGAVSDFVSRGLRKDGGVIWVSANARALRDGDGVLLGYEGTMEDITERKHLEEQLEHQAFHDSLTGLPNRLLLADRLEVALARAERRDDMVAVLFMDLDGFKRVNDSLGHEAGDRLLVEVAGRLRGCVRPEDTAARLGGDEFTVLLEGVAGEEDAIRAAERIIEVLRVPFEVDGHEVLTGTSIGIVLGSGSQDNTEALMRDADTAMYRAKSNGKGRYEVFEKAMGVRALERLELENSIRKAIDKGEFKLHYQPTVMLDTNGKDHPRDTGGAASPPSTVSLEALVRWEHPERGLVPPSEFIPLAEETGLMVPLGRWVLNEACRQASEWRERYAPEPGAQALTVSVNLSAEQFRQPGLVGDVADALRESGLSPEGLLLEIGESAVMEDAASTIATLQKLKDMGVGISIDDFGTGYSSLAHLERFPVDHLKIDRSLVHDLGEDTENRSVVLGVVGLAHALGLKVIAEGVETEGQLAQLREMRCDLAQGYHLAEPLPGDAAALLLAAGNAPKAFTN